RGGGPASGGRIDAAEDRQLLPRGDVILAPQRAATQNAARRREGDVTAAQVGDASLAATEAGVAASASHVDRVLDREIPLALLASHDGEPACEPGGRQGARIDTSAQGRVPTRVDLDEAPPEAPGGVEDA